MNVTSLTKCHKHIGVKTFTFTMIADIVIALLFAMANVWQEWPKGERIYFGSQIQGFNPWLSDPMHLGKISQQWKHSKGSSHSAWQTGSRETRYRMGPGHDRAAKMSLQLRPSPFPPPPNKGIILWLFQGIDPSIRSEPSWSIHLWKHLCTCALLIS